ncbi:MAG: hypothetical protein WC236_03930 [Gallionellaceae bacterium]|jgi:hypothetical protein
MEDNKKPENGLDVFRLLLAGKGRLSTAYWGFGVKGTIFIYIFALLGSLLLLPMALKDHRSVLESPIFATYFMVVYLILIAYQILVWVLIWRNAKNTDTIFWGYSAKFAVGFGVILFAFKTYQQI